MSSPAPLKRPEVGSTTSFVIAMLSDLNPQLLREVVGCTELVRFLVYSFSADATASSDLDRCLDSLRTLAGTTGLEAMSGPVERLAEIISGLDVDGRPGAAFGDAVDVVEIDVVLNEIVDAAAWPDEA